METRERGILMNSEMVCATLDDRKTQTRRIINPPPDQYEHAAIARPSCDFVLRNGNHIKCPYGKIGDRLWVREAWAVHFMYNDLPPREINKEGWIDADSIWATAHGDEPFAGSCSKRQKGKNRSSIHMPRWASRINLEITDIRVERISQISEEDAIAEGIEKAVDPIGTFRVLWDKINSKRGYSWQSDCWVWVVKFRKM